MSIIKALQENEFMVFLGFSGEMKATAKEIGIQNFEELSNDQWLRRHTGHYFHDHLAYRLRPDYEELKWPDKVFASTGDTEKDSMNNVIGVTAHCKCGHVFCDDVVHCKQQPKPIVDVRSSVSATEEKPEIVEIPVCCNNNSKYLYYIFEQETPLTQAPDHPDFIGFKYEDRRMIDTVSPTPLPRLYMDENGNVFSKYRDGYEVLTPTHVLFRKG